MTTATIRVPKLAYVFIVEDNADRILWFRTKLGSRIIGIYDKPERAIDALKATNLDILDIVFLDHDLGGPFLPPYSTDVAKYLVSQNPGIGNRVLIHSMNEVGAKNLQAILPGSLWFPFGSFDIEDK